MQGSREAGRLARPGRRAARYVRVVREGLTVQEMVDLAAAAGMTVVLPTGWAIFGPDSLPMPP